MKKWAKRACLGLSLVLSFSILLTGCKSIKKPIRLKERGIILAVGVDIGEDGGFVLTAQKFSPKGAGSLSAIDPSKTNDVIMEGKGKSLTKAFLDMQTKHAKELFLGDNSYIIFGKKAAEKGISQFLPFFNENYEQKKGASILISETTAKDIISNQVSGNIMPASSISEVIKKSKGIRTPGEALFYKLSADILSEKRSTLIPSIEKTKTIDDKDAFLASGTYFLKGDKLCDKLTQRELMGYLFLKNDCKNLFFPIEEDEKSYSVFITIKRLRKSFTFEEGRLYFDFKLKFSGQVKETIGEARGKNDKSFVKDVEGLLEKEIESCIKEFLKKTATENGCDGAELSLFLKNKNPKLYKKLEKDFSTYLKKARFNVSVNFELNNLGLQKG